MQETFNDHRLDDADRMTHASKHDQDLGDADDPAGHVHDGAGKEIGTTGIDRGEVLVDGIDRAEHPPRMTPPRPRPVPATQTSVAKDQSAIRSKRPTIENTT